MNTASRLYFAVIISGAFTLNVIFGAFLLALYVQTQNS